MPRTLALAFLLLLALGARADEAQRITDTAGLFQPAAVKAAAEQIARLSKAIGPRLSLAVTQGDGKGKPDAAFQPPAGTGQQGLHVALRKASREVVVTLWPPVFAERFSDEQRAELKRQFTPLFDYPKELPERIDAAYRRLQAVAHPGLLVLDRADLFSPAVVAAVGAKLERLAEQFDPRLCVETAVQASDLDPELTAEALKRMSSRQVRERLFKLARDRADLHRKEGLFRRAVFALVLREPSSVTVVGWPSDVQVDYSDFKRNRLRNILARGLGRDNSAALVELQQQFEEDLRSLVSRPSPVAGWQVLTLAGWLAGAWVVLRVVRSRVAGPDRPALFPPAVLGSIFGVPAALWVYDALYEAERPPAAAPTPPESPPLPELPAEPPPEVP